MALTAKKRKAIDAYLSGKTKKEAMLEAGYAETTASTKHSEIFNCPEMEAEIARRQNIAATRTNISLEWALGELKSIADANLGDILEIAVDGTYKVNMNKLGPDLKKALASFTVDEMTEGRGDEQKQFKRLKISLTDKLRAIELIIRHAGLSKEKTVVEIEGDLVDRLARGRERVRRTS